MIPEGSYVYRRSITKRSPDPGEGRTSSDMIAATAAETGGSVDASEGGELRSADLVDLVGFRVRGA